MLRVVGLYSDWGRLFFKAAREHLDRHDRTGAAFELASSAERLLKECRLHSAARVLRAYRKYATLPADALGDDVFRLLESSLAVDDMEANIFYRMEAESGLKPADSSWRKARSLQPDP